MVDKTPLFQEIAESIRQAILYGRLGPDDLLPTVREMAEKWDCSPGTVQRAYNELAEQGLIAGRPGAGTRVTAAAGARPSPLRRATLINESESFLLRMLAEGYTVLEIQRALQLALDRWRGAEVAAEPAPQTLRFVGSHDPALSLLSARLAQESPDYLLQLSYAGSLGGLIALARHEADLAGSHLWDERSNSYNRPFVRRLLPGRRVALLRLADRRLGLVVAAGNPLDITSLADLPRRDVRFINRQEGAGTRVWLEVQLARLGIAHVEIQGYDQEALTHSAVAGAIAADQADAGVAVEAVALAYGLAFIPLATESYDLVIPEESWERPPVQALLRTLSSDETKAEIEALGGYDTSATGQLTWIT